MDRREIIKPNMMGFPWFSSKPCLPKGNLACHDPIFRDSNRCPVVKKTHTCEVKGVQRQFRNKTKAVLKPLFKVG